MVVDTIRHINIFSDDIFGDTQVDIVGVGATGSKIALSLAKHGVTNLHVWDFDKVEEHNVANQAFRIKDIGKPKVDALKELIKESTGLDITAHNEKVVDQKLGKVVFLLTDTMESRKAIFNNSLKYKVHTSVVIETRLGVYSGRVYTFDPNVPSHIKSWEETLCSDDESEESACGGKITVGASADMLSGLAVWQFINWSAVNLNTAKENKDVDHNLYENELIYSLPPLVVMSNKFKQ